LTVLVSPEYLNDLEKTAELKDTKSLDDAEYARAFHLDRKRKGSEFLQIF
jgi:DnaJ-domain-containing protein 1